MAQKKKWPQIALSVILVLGALGMLSTLQSFSWRKLAELLRGFSPGWVALAIGLSTVQVFWQLLRYWVIFRPEETSFIRAFPRFGSGPAPQLAGPPSFGRCLPGDSAHDNRN